MRRLCYQGRVSARGSGPNNTVLELRLVGEASLNRIVSKDFLSGLMFIAFGLTALYFGRHLAVGTAVRMGPGWVPHALSYILLGLGFFISVVAWFGKGEPV